MLPRRLILSTIVLATIGTTLATTPAMARRTLDISGPNDPNRQYCDIVVRARGGNPTQDMTGSIGHQKSYNSGGGKQNPVLCYLPGTRG